jgi:hypothetical protein
MPKINKKKPPLFQKINKIKAIFQKKIAPIISLSVPKRKLPSETALSEIYKKGSMNSQFTIKIE